MFAAAFRAQPFSHIVDAGKAIAWRKCYSRNGYVRKTKRAMTLLTIEMYMLIVVGIMPIMTMAKFITHAIATILKDVDQPMLSEECEGSENAGLVDGQDFVFQFCERHGTLGIGQRFDYNDAVGSGFDTMLREQLLTFVLT